MSVAAAELCTQRSNSGPRPTALRTATKGSLGANYGIVVARQMKSLQIGPRTQSCTGESTTARSADPTVGGQTAAKSRGAVELQPTALRPAKKDRSHIGRSMGSTNRFAVRCSTAFSSRRG